VQPVAVCRTGRTRQSVTRRTRLCASISLLLYVVRLRLKHPRGPAAYNRPLMTREEHTHTHTHTHTSNRTPSLFTIHARGSRCPPIYHICDTQFAYLRPPSARRGYSRIFMTAVTTTLAAAHATYNVI
jgi:hypothetical protein